MSDDSGGCGRVRVPDHINHVDDDLRHVVVMNTENGQIFGLDNSAAVIWKALAEHGSIEAAASALTAQYDIDTAHALSEAREFAEQLVASELLLEVRE